MSTTAARIEDLIRTLEGTEVPATGRWQIGTGQPVRLSSAGLRRRTTAGRIVAGTFDVTDDLVGSALEITVAVDDADGPSDAGVPTRDPPGTLTLTLAVTELSAAGRWTAVGEASAGSGSSPVIVDIEYHGVYRHARHTSLWLTLDGDVDVDGASGQSTRRRLRRTRAHLASDLTLHPAAA